MRVLTQLIDSVFSLLNVKSPVSFDPLDTLVLRRRIRGSFPSDQPTILAIQEECENGFRQPCSPLHIGYGDLIESVVSVDITLSRGFDGLPRTHVFLCPESITRLRSPFKVCRVSYILVLTMIVVD